MALKKIKEKVFASNSLIRELIGLTSWFLLLTYPFFGTMFVMLFIFLVHPITFFIPLIPPVLLYVREQKRRSRVLMCRTDGIDLSSERQAQAIEEFVKLIKKRKKKEVSKSEQNKREVKPICYGHYSEADRAFRKCYVCEYQYRCPKKSVHIEVR